MPWKPRTLPWGCSDLLPAYCQSIEDGDDGENSGFQVLVETPHELFRLTLASLSFSKHTSPHHASVERLFILGDSFTSI